MNLSNQSLLSAGAPRAASQPRPHPRHQPLPTNHLAYVRREHSASWTSEPRGRPPPKTEHIPCQTEHIRPKIGHIGPKTGRIRRRTGHIGPTEWTHAGRAHPAASQPAPPSSRRPRRTCPELAEGALALSLPKGAVRGDARRENWNTLPSEVNTIGLKSEHIAA